MGRGVTGAAVKASAVKATSTSAETWNLTTRILQVWFVKTLFVPLCICVFDPIRRPANCGSLKGQEETPTRAVNPPRAGLRATLRTHPCQASTCRRRVCQAHTDQSGSSCCQAVATHHGPECGPSKRPQRACWLKPVADTRITRRNYPYALLSQALHGLRVSIASVLARPLLRVLLHHHCASHPVSHNGGDKTEMMRTRSNECGTGGARSPSRTGAPSALRFSTSLCFPIAMRWRACSPRIRASSRAGGQAGKVNVGHSWRGPSARFQRGPSSQLRPPR